MMRKAWTLPNYVFVVTDRCPTQWTCRVCVSKDTSTTSRSPPPSTGPAAKAVFLLQRQPPGIKKLADVLLGKRMGLPALTLHSLGLDFCNVRRHGHLLQASGADSCQQNRPPIRFQHCKCIDPAPPKPPAQAPYGPQRPTNVRSGRRRCNCHFFPGSSELRKQNACASARQLDQALPDFSAVSKQRSEKLPRGASINQSRCFYRVDATSGKPFEKDSPPL